MSRHLSTCSTHTFDIELEKLTDTITIYPFGDVHRYANTCDVDRWKWFLKKSKENDNAENTYYLGMGDYDDFASYSEGKKLKAIGLHDTTLDTIEEIVEKRNRMFAKEIAHMRGRLIGIIGGNHTWINGQGITSDEDLANRMGCAYLGWLSFIKLRINIKNNNTIINVFLLPCHGLGGGRVLGSSVRKVEELFYIFPSADVYLMGHDHGRNATPQPRLIPWTNRSGEFKLKQQRQFYIRTGSFMKSYEAGDGKPGAPSFAGSRLMRPADLGTVELRISLHRDRKEGENRIITDIGVLI
jgi:hypothetical protein